jgi:hypothetical protein
MASTRRRNPPRPRRRVADDGDDDGSVITDAVDDSQSEPSVPSDVDDDADADDSDLSDADVPDTVAADKPASKKPNVPNGLNGPNGPNGTLKRHSSAPRLGTPSALLEEHEKHETDDKTFQTVADTELMMNGLKISSEGPEGSEGLVESGTLDFDSMGGGDSKTETPADRRRREHDEYKKKRDADPAFIPNRGAFFMHDTRMSAAGQNASRPFGRGRGRGRGDVPRPYASVV